MPTMIIVRGLPGSGKTTLAKSLRGVLVEADQYHTNSDGIYRYDGTKAGKAHKWCLEETERLLREGKDVVVANVFEQRWQLRPYFELGEKLGVQVTSIRTTGEFKSNHSVPSWIVDGMANRWQAGYGEPFTFEGIVVSVPRSTEDEVVFRVESYSEVQQTVTAKIYVRAPRNKVATEPFAGEVWQVHGVYQPDPFFFENVIPEFCTRTKPTGQNLLYFLITHNRFHRIVAKTARRLYAKIPDLQGVLDAGELEPLTAIDKGKLSRQQAENLLQQWREYTSELRIVNEMDKLQLPASLALRVLEIWGQDAMEKLRDDPYRLLALYPWSRVDKISVEIFNIDLYDPRRQAAAAEQVCYRHYDRGNTAIRHDMLSAELTELLGYNINIYDVAYKAWGNRICHFVEDGIFQLAGAYALEHFIESQVAIRLSNEHQDKPIKTKFDIKKLREFERRKTIILRASGAIGESESFALNASQRLTVEAVLLHSFFVIFGGAGVGKTTVLEAIFDQISENSTIFPMALTGRAAKVIKDSTGYEAQTIAKFLYTAPMKTIPSNAWVFIDEASMLDLPTTFRLLKILPYNAHICFIGDQCQLAPIGPGLILHPMYHAQSIPQMELTEVHRQSGDSEIPVFLKIIRDAIGLKHDCISQTFDKFVGLKKKDFGVSFIEINSRLESDLTAFKIYNELVTSGKVILIGATNSTCQRLNEKIAQDHLLAVQYRNLACSLLNLSVIGAPDQKQKATIGDQILWHGRNDYHRDLYNGMFGELMQVFSESICGIDSNGYNVKFVAEAQFDGKKLLLTELDLDYVALGYAVTCHKAQGSKFERVIIVLEETVSKSIDSTWLYTAVTRAERQVIIIGNQNFFHKRLIQQSKASQRLVGLHFK